jgi:hypothetical protein
MPRRAAYVSLHEVVFSIIDAVGHVSQVPLAHIIEAAQADFPGLGREPVSSKLPTQSSSITATFLVLLKNIADVVRPNPG